MHLRNAIHNVFFDLIFAEADDDVESLGWKNYDGGILKIIWRDYLVLKLRSDLNLQSFKNEIENHIMSAAWYKVYGLIEFTIREAYADERRELIQAFNYEFEKHNSGYRITRNQIVPITNKTEIKSIEELISVASKRKYKGLEKHISDAIEFISLKPHPKPASSVRESITAVEWICRSITKTNTLGDGLKALNKMNFIPNEINASIQKLYDFTNSKEGMRHAQITDETMSSPEIGLHKT